jgi:DNA-binding MarR family transcriptional regulator
MLQEAQRIRDMIVRLARKSRGDLKKRLARSGTGITPLSYNLLSFLADRKRTLQEIASEMEINPPSLVAAADILEQKGLLQRTADASDRRQRPLRITAAGRAVLSRIPKVAKGDSFTASLSRLDPAARRELADLLTNLLD